MCSKLRDVCLSVHLGVHICVHNSQSITKHFAKIVIMEIEAIILSFSTNGNSRHKIKLKFYPIW